MKLTLTGRIPSKKNSRRHFKTPTGRRIVMPSAAYERWHTEAGYQLLSHRPKQPLDGPISLTCTFYLKGRLDSDLDNMMASVADLLEDMGFIQNDKQIRHADLTKYPLASDFKTEITIAPLTPQ